MVEQIYDIDELEDEMKKGHNVSIQLTQDEIKEWKDSGKFAHLKKELTILPRVKFSCTKLDDGDCVYYFVANTTELMKRITVMLHELYYKNNNLPLVKCEVYDVPVCFHPRAEGCTQSCTLF